MTLSTSLEQKQFLPSSTSVCWNSRFPFRTEETDIRLPHAAEDNLIERPASAMRKSCFEGDMSRILDIITSAEDVMISPLEIITPSSITGCSNMTDDALDLFVENLVQEEQGSAKKRRKLSHEQQLHYLQWSVEEDLSLFEPTPFAVSDCFGKTTLPLEKLNFVFKEPSVVLEVDKITATSEIHTIADSSDEASKESKPVLFRRYQADQWMNRFEDLIDFKKENGHCLVPHSYPSNQHLAQWVKRQRYQYKLKSLGRHNTLTDARQNELETMGFVWDSHKAAWDEKFEALKKFHAKHGNCLVPTNFEQDKQLAVWVKCQRRQLRLFAQGRRSTMTEERFELLETLNFDWNPRNL